MIKALSVQCFKNVAITSTFLFACSAYASDFPRLDFAPPAGENISGLEPVFDFDGDGCLPSAGISRTGQQNDGLRTTGKITGDCRSHDFMESSNTLHRGACVDANGARYCGHFYSLYFEKDQVIDYFGGGHRHDWEYAAVWTINGAVSHGSYSAHGALTTKPANELPFEGSHLKIVYHKDGPGTHAMRFAKPNEVAENPYNAFVTPVITSWYTVVGDGLSNIAMRNRLNRYDYGSGTIPLKDSRFLDNLNRFKPAGFPQFSMVHVEMENPAGNEVSLFEHCDFGGYKILLGEGSYSLGQLQSMGMSNDDVSSIQVPAGYKVELYEHDNFQGSIVGVQNQHLSCLTAKNFNDNVSSIKVIRL